MPTSQSSSVAALGGTQGFARKEPATGSQSAVQRVVEAVAERVEAILDGELREQERGASFGASATTTETDPELEALRERRLEALKRAAAARSRWCALGHGRLHELDDEEALLEACRSSERVVGVFWRLRTAPETQPLQDALAHALRSLAQQHLETRFWVAEAERFPSMCERLGVQVLPSILLIRNQQLLEKMPSHKTFRIKQKLAKKAKQNRPVPQWFRMKTDNRIRYNMKRRHWRRTKLGI